MDFSIKACSTSMVDLSRPLSFNINIFTSTFDLHWLCDEALSHFSHQATTLLILTGALQTGLRYVCVSVLRSVATTLAFSFFIRESTKFLVSYKSSDIIFWNLSNFSWFQNAIIHKFQEPHFLEIIGRVIWNFVY